MPQALAIPLATAAIGIGGSLLKSSAEKAAIGEATAAQERGTLAGIEEQRRQFDKLQELLSPFVGTGAEAFGAQGALVGLGGPEAEAAAIAGIEAGPEFKELVRLGEEGILQNVSATGGLRGGNVQAALAQFRPQILSQLINQRFGRLGGIAQLGQASAVGVGAGALQTGRGIAGLQLERGQVGAEGALGRGRSRSNLFGDISGSLGALLGGGAFNIGGGTGDPLGGLTIPGPGDITGGVF